MGRKVHSYVYNESLIRSASDEFLNPVFPLFSNIYPKYSSAENQTSRAECVNQLSQKSLKKSERELIRIMIQVKPYFQSNDSESNIETFNGQIFGNNKSDCYIN